MHGTSSSVFPRVPVDVAFDVAYQGDVYLGCEMAKKVSEGKRTDGRLVKCAHQRVQRWYYVPLCWATR